MLSITKAPILRDLGYWRSLCIAKKLDVYNNVAVVTDRYIELTSAPIDAELINGAVAVTSTRKTSHRQSQGLMVVNGSLWLTARPIDAVPQDSAIVHPDCTRFLLFASTFFLNLSLAYKSKLSPTL